MKKITLFYSILFILLFANSGYANFFNVAPQVTTTINIDNQTYFIWGRDLAINSCKQDVTASFSSNDDWWHRRQGKITVIMPENDAGSFYLTYTEFGRDTPVDPINQCEFNVTADTNGNITVTEISSAGAYITCTLTGSSKNNNLTLHLNNNVNYLKKKFNN